MSNQEVMIHIHEMHQVLYKMSNAFAVNMTNQPNKHNLFMFIEKLKSKEPASSKEHGWPILGSYLHHFSKKYHI